jgi:hypothetical protein
MRWAWDVEPHGGVKLMGPMITLMGRRQERTIWSSLKRVLEALVATGLTLPSVERGQSR